jgi:hypothetical protein
MLIKILTLLLILTIGGTLVYLLCIKVFPSMLKKN